MGAGQGHRVVGGRFVLRSLFKRSGSWVARVRDSRTGKVHFHSTRERTKRKAEQVALEWVEELLDRARGVVVSIGIKQAFEEWLSLKNVRPETLRQYRQDFSGVIAPAFRGQAVDAISPLDIERFLKSLESSGRAPRTRQKHLMTMRSFLGWCVRQGHAERNVTDGIRAPKIPRRRPRSLTHDEARRLLQACRKGAVKEITNHNGTWTQEFVPPRYLFPVTLTALHTGLRLGNLRRLTWANVDLDKKLISISAEDMKNNMDFVVPIHAELADVLRCLASETPHATPDDLVSDIAEVDFRKAWKGALVRAGLPELRFHEATRKSFASWVAARASYAVLKALLGHALPDVTGIYVNVTVEELRRVVRELPGLLFR